MATVTQLMSADEFFEFVHHPDQRDRIYELEKGEVVEMSRPGKMHGLVCANIVRILGNFAFARKKGYVCSNDTGVIVERNPDTVRGPDVLFFEDVMTLEEVERKFADKPPRLAVEVLSPNDKPGRLNRRIREQIRFGTPLVWVVDPDYRCVTIYRPGQGKRIEQSTVEEDEALTGEDVLPDFRCMVSDFFAFPG